MKVLESQQYDPRQLSGRNRRLLYEWRQLDERLAARRDISFSIVRRNAAGLPVAYLIDYHLRSICGVEHVDSLNEDGVENRPLFSEGFRMALELPTGYPDVDAPPMLNFLTLDASGQPIAHPWHPNIRYFGAFAGKVCINMADTYTDLSWGVERVASYLRYDTYHATLEPPYPEDLQVAAWVRHQGEPNGWIIFEQKTN